MWAVQTLAFAAACVLVHVADTVSGGRVSVHFFGVGPLSSFAVLSPLSYWRLVSHIFGHVSWAHLNGNMVNLLLVRGPCVCV
jgi:membrane associated rhomboid family serine protease